MARTDQYQEIFGLYAENGLFSATCPCPSTSQMETFAAVSGIVLGAIECALSCFRIDALNRGAATSSRRAWGWENVPASQMH
jgi:hypothetical protein